MLSFLRCEWQARKGTVTSPTFDENSMPLMYPKVPQQENGYDCGVFVLLFFKEFLKRKFPIEDLMSGEILRWYSQDSAPNLRKKIEDILLLLGS
ncbi:Sentrin-specific protease 6 [Desmophyllum pertusum]|uniref:Sentrin-specific protease 6 n=1 Tax=Desmophyllum pertusum TaxID=174260 RepID=A0A9W9ZIN2_9CNID|nr:Sentrin-specific protease 6 [Desmophyllum pertusum]